MTGIQYVAFAPEAITELEELNGSFGELLYDGKTQYKTIIGRWDDSAHTKIRAANFQNELPTKLNDGRSCIIGALYSDKFLLAITDGEVDNVEILTEDQYQGLKLKDTYV